MEAVHAGAALYDNQIAGEKCVIKIIFLRMSILLILPQPREYIE
jgi:hypothetical protein